jgi:hypothetical protein
VAVATLGAGEGLADPVAAGAVTVTVTDGVGVAETDGDEVGDGVSAAFAVFELPPLEHAVSTRLRVATEMNTGRMMDTSR